MSSPQDTDALIRELRLPCAGNGLRLSAADKIEQLQAEVEQWKLTAGIAGGRLSDALVVVKTARVVCSNRLEVQFVQPLCEALAAADASARGRR